MVGSCARRFVLLPRGSLGTLNECHIGIGSKRTAIRLLYPQLYLAFFIEITSIMEFFNANIAHANCGAKMCTNEIVSATHRYEDDARGDATSQLSAASTSHASGNVASVGVQATTAVDDESDSNTLFFSQEASSVFDKALEMHVAPTDDPPMWGDDLEDYMEVANMLGDMDDLSTSSNDVASGDFYSLPNTKIATKQATCLSD